MSKLEKKISNDTIRMWPAKAQISLHMCAGWPESLQTCTKEFFPAEDKQWMICMLIHIHVYVVNIHVLCQLVAFRGVPGSKFKKEKERTLKLLWNKYMYPWESWVEKWNCLRKMLVWYKQMTISWWNMKKVGIWYWLLFNTGWYCCCISFMAQSTY